MNAFYRTPRKTGYRGQAITEFAIVLPILMVLLVGILEVGRMVFTYAAVTNASREAVRYASAFGLDQDPDDGNKYLKYKYCKGIRNTASRSAYFMHLQTSDIVIQYDHGPGHTPFDTCLAASGQDDVVVNKPPYLNSDRVLVTITTTYRPLVKLIPIRPRTITSSSARTILGELKLDP